MYNTNHIYRNPAKAADGNSVRKLQMKSVSSFKK